MSIIKKTTRQATGGFSFLYNKSKAKKLTTRKVSKKVLSIRKLLKDRNLL